MGYHESNLGWPCRRQVPYLQYNSPHPAVLLIVQVYWLAGQFQTQCCSEASPDRDGSIKNQHLFHARHMSYLSSSNTYLTSNQKFGSFHHLPSQLTINLIFSYEQGETCLVLCAVHLQMRSYSIWLSQSHQEMGTYFKVTTLTISLLISFFMQKPA